MSTGESKRPSLTTGSPSRPTVAALRAEPARILADMEQRKPSRAQATHRVSPLLLVCVLGSALSVGGYLYFVGSSTPWIEGDRLVRVPAAGDVSSIPVVTAPITDAAVIIDDGVPAAEPEGTSISAQTPSPVDGSSLAGSAAADPVATTWVAANPPASATNAGSNSTTRIPAGSTPRLLPKTRSPAVANFGSAGSGREPDLLATLLQNIRGQEAAQQTLRPPLRHTEKLSAIDVLVAQIQRNNAESINGGSVRTSGLLSRSPSVQAELNQCPAANTVAGIECRSRVCAKYAGEDAACPR